MPGTRVKIKWHGEQVKKEIARQMEKRLDWVGELVRGQVVKNISEPTRSKGPSEPGDFPHADAGKLRQSIFWERTDGRTVIVGSALKYALYLEMGTSTMAARPFMYRSVMDAKEDIERILSRKTR